MNIKTIASSSSGNCSVIESNGYKLIIDCGIPVKRIRQAIGSFENVLGCFITHSHLDHAGFVDQLINQTNIPVFCTEETKRGLKNNSHRCQAISHNQKFDLGVFKVVSVRLSHDVPCYGFLIMDEIDKLFYATDTREVNYTFPGLNKAMIEANYSFDLMAESDLANFVIRRAIDSHLSIDKALEFISRHPDLEEIHLLHLSDRHSDAAKFQRMVEDLTGVLVYVADK